MTTISMNNKKEIRENEKLVRVNGS